MPIAIMLSSSIGPPNRSEPVTRHPVLESSPVTAVTDENGPLQLPAPSNVTGADLEWGLVIRSEQNERLSAIEPV